MYTPFRPVCMYVCMCGDICTIIRHANVSTSLNAFNQEEGKKKTSDMISQTCFDDDDDDAVDAVCS